MQKDEDEQVDKAVRYDPHGKDSIDDVELCDHRKAEPRSTINKMFAIVLGFALIVSIAIAFAPPRSLDQDLDYPLISDVPPPSASSKK